MYYNNQLIQDTLSKLKKANISNCNTITFTQDELNIIIQLLENKPLYVTNMSTLNPCERCSGWDSHTKRCINYICHNRHL